MDYKKASDKELWECCRHKDDMNAYNEIFDRYITVLLRQSSHYIKNEMDAEELVMDLLFSIWQKRISLTNLGENMRAYLYRSLHNRILNHLHKNIQKTISIETIPDYELGNALAADHNIIDSELTNAYQDKLDSLSPQRQQVFLLSRDENLSYRQISQRLGLSVNTVENHMSSALNILRESTRNLTTLSLLLVFLA